MLLIDAGNTRVKWAFIAGDVWQQQGVVENIQVETLGVAFQGLPEPKRIFASNVAGEKMAQRLQKVCALFSCPITFIGAQAEQCGVRNLYQHPAQLGSDRWSALLAAWQQEHSACLVVNCGTATTLDALSNQGEFLGGMIVPGINMMQRSLASGTAVLAVEAVGLKGSWSQFPRNTIDAMVSGSIQATVSVIRAQFEVLIQQQGATRCVLSGGAADSVQLHLKMPVLRVENLVLMGLQIIGQEAIKAGAE